MPQRGWHTEEEARLHGLHDLEVNAVLREDGCMDVAGRLWSWHGKATLEKLAKAGHTNLDFWKCKCVAKADKGPRR